MKTLLAALAIFAAATAAFAQEEERLWMPEGYRLLTADERQALPPAELQAIGARNQELLRAAVHAMSPEERRSVATALESYGNGHELSQVEKQYVAMTSMQLMAAGMEEENRKMKKAAQERRQALLREQEETSKGFPSDQESVEREARAVEGAMTARADYRQLYLRILKPLRARPWNHEVRYVFRRIVRGGQLDLLEPALAFAEARQKESPQEGAWDSLRAFLVLSFQGDVPEAKRLFAIAIEKNANDVESRIFPLLIAEIEGNAAEVARYEPRAREAWPKAEDLEKVLVDSVAVLPESLRAKAKGTVEAKYRERHPSDWEARNKNLLDRFYAKDYAGVERETDALLALPATVLPDDDRLTFSLLRIRAKAATGRCTEAETAIRDLEERAERVHPARFDPDAAPAAHTEAEIRQMRAGLKSANEQRLRLERWQKGDVAGMPAELSQLSEAERRAVLEDLLAETLRSTDAAHRLVDGKDDASAVSAWNRTELEEWEKSHAVSETGSYDIFGEAESISIAARGETADCWLERKDPLSAQRVVSLCVGGGRNWHSGCVNPLRKAGTLLAQTGHVPEAMAIYRRLESAGLAVGELAAAIEKAAPGSLAPPQPKSR